MARISAAAAAFWARASAFNAARIAAGKPPVCEECLCPGDLVWVEFFGHPDGWRCRDIATCVGRDWPEEVPDDQEVA